MAKGNRRRYTYAGAVAMAAAAMRARAIARSRAIARARERARVLSAKRHAEALARASKLARIRKDATAKYNVTSRYRNLDRKEKVRQERAFRRQSLIQARKEFNRFDKWTKRTAQKIGKHPKEWTKRALEKNSRLGTNHKGYKAMWSGWQEMRGRFKNWRKNTRMGKIASRIVKQAKKNKVINRAAKTSARGARSFVGKAVGRVSRIGDAYGVIDAFKKASENKNNAGQHLGKATGQIVGSAIGATLGNLIPIPVVGSVVGSMVGGWIGEKLGGWIGKKIDKARKSKPEATVAARGIINARWGRVSSYARGGIVSGGSKLVRVAEEGSPEMIIPLGAHRRQRGMELWERAGRMMSVSGGGMKGVLEMKQPKIRISTPQAPKIDVMGTIRDNIGSLAEDVASVLDTEISGQYANTPA